MGFRLLKSNLKMPEMMPMAAAAKRMTVMTFWNQAAETAPLALAQVMMAVTTRPMIRPPR